MIEFNTDAIVGSGRDAAVIGVSNEYIVLAMLMTKFPNSSKVDMPLSSYDLIIERSDESGTSFIRAQVKTATKSISFVGGSRGGVDRTYDRFTNNSKIYVQDETKSDVVIGIHRSQQQTTLYMIPTLLIKHICQQSLSIKKANVFSDWHMISLCDKELELKQYLRGQLSEADPLLKIASFKDWLSKD
ncbi:hypothetical protein SAMN02745225_02297 [Ferrithrix thermotolerans DSM 19514]|uniref:PD(D/E)XK endonuclease domain-containing protein n=1 Tax=Ferrithrix thermotolerans DSM 19514 TaxID=1121881 RepID=A0A1M4YBX8_9ACTN|nr:hypothetical protein [Ferrithrix thermotolerans]SHF03086.1 hypothetical protein SAMN02745225_02297 [Ferrithrix thermotolerans DSM 19514]